MKDLDQTKSLCPLRFLLLYSPSLYLDRIKSFTRYSTMVTTWIDEETYESKRVYSNVNFSMVRTPHSFDQYVHGENLYLPPPDLVNIDKFSKQNPNILHSLLSDYLYELIYWFLQ